VFGLRAGADGAFLVPQTVSKGEWHEVVFQEPDGAGAGRDR
jgi:hypothetical protein